MTPDKVARTLSKMYHDALEREVTTRAHRARARTHHGVCRGVQGPPDRRRTRLHLDRFTTNLMLGTPSLLYPERARRHVAYE